MKLISCVGFALLFTASCHGLRCWVCENAASNDDCTKYGREQECQPNEDACQNSLRRGSFGMLLTKRCKQALACDNNFIQNPRAAWYPTQCNFNAPSSVCRCCCGESLCNKADISCEGPTTTTTTATTTEMTQTQMDDRPPPTLTCEAPEAPTNGGVDCGETQPDANNMYELETTCSYSCNKGFYLKGEESTTCELVSNRVARFTTPPPKCRPEPKCFTPLQPTNGKTDCETEPINGIFYALGSVCHYSCNEGYRFVKHSQTITVCQYFGSTKRFAFFNPSPPYCEKIPPPPPTCPMPSNPQNGKVTCFPQSNNDGEYKVETICIYSCDKGYKREGPSKVTCRKNTKGDTASFIPSTVPVCRAPPRCDPPGSPVNGLTECRQSSLPNGKYQLNDICDYICDPGYELTNGHTSTTCLRDFHAFNRAKFFPEPPSCARDRPRCKVLPEPSNGSRRCSDENNVGSVCQYRCNGRYKIFPNYRYKSLICREDRTWSLPPPCCLPSCPPQAFMDLVIVLDSSSSIQAENWPIMLNFVSDFIKLFNIGPKAANVGVFRYNSKVDVDSQILLNQYPHNRTALLQAIKQIPYDGTGTHTGNALGHARDAFFRQENGDRPRAPNVILLVTDGNAQDRDLLFFVADDLRSKDVAIFTLGITSGAIGLDFEELERVSGQLDRVFVLNGGFKNLNERLAQHFGNLVCSARSCRAA